MKFFLNVLRAGLILSPVMVADFAAAQSFDCNKAKSDVEHAICASDQLSYFDDLVAQAYRIALDNPKTRAKARQTQKAWLMRRNKCGGDHSCLRAAYQSRLSAIETGGFDARAHGKHAASNVPTCKPSDLRIELSNVVGDGGAGSISNAYYVVHKGKRACRIEGYPTLSAYDEAGKPKRNGVSYDNNSDYTTQPPPRIAPIVLSASNPTAWFLLEGASGCDSGVKVKIALPHSRKWLTTWEYPGGGCVPVNVSPIRPIATLLPPP